MMIHVHPTRLPLLLSCLLLLLSSFQTSLLVHAEKLTKNQEKVNLVWNQMVSDFDAFKAAFADDAKIKMCLRGMPFCTEGTFNEMLEGFRVAFSSFQVKHKFLTGKSHPDTFLVEWVNSIQTNEGCRAMWWGYATYEFNDDGKIKRFLGMSEESEDVIHCVSKVSGINVEL
ncbi:expressed unknown protein [Seminavis robusta]|uniref:SnoaL-like domain-containing protein n=1 Tax=Seminavis robusta TaxID=568900 RepID=A0A9N8HK70_9STRA|nr:expressed unknown protein [Seminavis robusta]|eukprot:Sro710_g191090.1 n/a (171) ;mRNA; r:27510-28022